MTVEKSAVFTIRVTPELLARCHATARAAAMTLPDWVRTVLALAANQGAFAPQLKKPRR